LATSVVRFQALWHLVTVEIVGAPASIPAGMPAVELDNLSWPITPAVQSGYRLEERSDGWEVRQEADLLGVTDEFESAWEMLRARVRARCFELAGRKGWTGFTGTLLSSAQDRVCLLGPGAERGRAGGILARAGWVVESHDGWVSRGGNVLAAPLPPSNLAALPPSNLAVRELRIATIDRIAVWRPDGDGSAGSALTGPQAMMALVASADRTCQSPGEVLRSGTELLNRASPSTTWTPQILGPPWYVCALATMARPGGHDERS
jgi:hypothetical protein